MDTSTAAGVVGTGIGVILLIWLALGLLSGLVVGALARFLLPGPDPMSWIRTLGYGIGGSFLGGLIGRLLKLSQGLDFVLAVACAAALIWFFTRRNKTPSMPPGPGSGQS
jgi:uncharacterized membrane protein YeaQ/YmgE (transglycosylase-associated protein family)